MPFTAKTAKEATTALLANAAKRLKQEEVSDEETVHEVQEAPVVKKTPAKATAKASATKNMKKRAHESDSEDSEEFLLPARISKSKASSAKASSSAPSSGKKSTGKKATAAKNLMEVDSESTEDSSSEEEEMPKPKRTAKAAKAVTVKLTSTPKKSAAKSEEDSGEEGDEPKLVEVPTNFSEPTLAPGELKIVSWNVAGYRAVLKKGFETYLKNENPDVICLQEVKVPSSEEITKLGYHACFFGCKLKPGLHGTAILSKTKPINVSCNSELDQEGRVMIAEFPSFFILNTYVPNSGQKLERLSYRIDWDKKLQKIFLDLQKKKPVLWCGDLNVAQHPIDIANPTGNVRQCNQKAFRKCNFLFQLDLPN
jgi:chemotaxis protein histidine kinase CheA